MRGHIGNKFRNFGLILLLAFGLLGGDYARAANVVAPHGDVTTEKQARVTLTSAQLLALASTPVTLIPAPVDTTNIILVKSVTAVLNYGTATYTGGSVSIQYAGSANDVVVASATNTAIGALVDGTGSGMLYASGVLAGTNNLVADAGQAVRIKNTSTAFTVGDGTLTLILDYQLIHTP